ncbi:MAG: DEAD/DEAH box helicase [Mycoplasmataceae bacterium]|nr:DEAD/DEAH box helicase [Mycoplasmataceae bacterium]
MLFNQPNIRYWIRNALKKQGINELTKIQEQVLPYVLNNKNVIITSQTGSGKTLCYLLPILNKIDVNINKIQSLIILPTKELTRQVYSRLIDFKKENNQLKMMLLIGNNDINKQEKVLKNNPPQIVVGTISKVLDFVKSKKINRDINTLVLDEADMLIDMGFIRQVNELFSFVNSNSLQKIACSATTHTSLANHLSKYLGNTKVISANKSIWANDNVTNYLVYSNNYNQIETLFGLLSNINPYFCVIFCNTKKNADFVYEQLLNREFNVALLHKDLSSRQRKNIYKGASNAKYQYLVATDLVSRGLDIEGIDVVISYGLPDEDIWYMHRIGRTGRLNKTGKAYTIYENGIDNKILRLSKKHINWNYLQLTKTKELIEKPLQLRFKHKLMLDQQTNNQIKKIIGTQSKKIRPGYKKKIKQQILKIKQKKRHEFIEKKIKQRLLENNIQRTKHKKYH